MSWENWTWNGWHVDHIIPLDSFNLSNREELLKACNYTNLQPLWAGENLRKNNKITINNNEGV
jgi:5-methylcytosine-specific restriction endonuclease McrA